MHHIGPMSRLTAVLRDMHGLAIAAASSYISRCRVNKYKRPESRISALALSKTDTESLGLSRGHPMNPGDQRQCRRRRHSDRAIEYPRSRSIWNCW
ncbi:hypothetical protein A5906_13945 [Bradyrhizobium sacchari]|uniref:hypothetical protein n=1 Tax=Bradyrhizobium sacchari TaxID=1399419 RepID=UPI0009B04C06|nr:hypothetical protein [Bradyrhizobium sacchari]OPY94417.1 hypothetical protein A5906_13945 [Bradyrhizobium sacchari]